MIDLETLGTKPNACITQIGAMFFEPVSGGKCRNDVGFEYHVNIQSCFDHGLTMDGDTVSWWLTQDNAAREAFVLGQQKNPPSLPEALMALINWPLANGYAWNGINVWANSPDFDLTILQSAFIACGLEVPWRYNAKRDCRTLFWMVGGPPAVENVGTGHKAIDDAEYQACQVQAAMGMIRR